MRNQDKIRILNAAALVTGVLALVGQVTILRPLTILDVVIILLLLNIFYANPMYFYSRDKQEEFEDNVYWRYEVTGRTDYVEVER